MTIDQMIKNLEKMRDQIGGDAKVVYIKDINADFNVVQLAEPVTIGSHKVAGLF